MASMFNKALEVIEAKELFDLAPEQIEVLVHRQSLVHALVEFQDAGIIAHVGPHDMRHAIGYALYGEIARTFRLSGWISRKLRALILRPLI